MSNIDRPLSPHLQVYRWQITMVLSILHRFTGIAMAVGIVVLVFWLAAAASGPEPYTRMRDLLGTVPGMVVLAGLLYAFCYHLCNGIRHLFWDVGMGFEKSQMRASGWTVVVASAALWLLALIIAAGAFGGGQ